MTGIEVHGRPSAEEVTALLVVLLQARRPAAAVPAGLSGWRAGRRAALLTVTHRTTGHHGR